MLVGAKTSRVVKWSFPNYVWSVATEKKILYLTFDDGPTPEVTEQVLEILKQHHAKATFFCIGRNVASYPVIFNRILREGHTIGNHTYNHIKGWKNKKGDYIENVLLSEQVMCDLSEVKNSEFRMQSGVISNAIENKNTDAISNECEKSNSELITPNSKLFRPPYGQIKPSQGKALRKLGYKIIMWDVLSYDWQTSTPKEKVLKNVLDNATSGSIIVFHDSIKASANMLYALPRVLEHFSKKGYKFECLM